VIWVVVPAASGATMPPADPNVANTAPPQMPNAGQGPADPSNPGQMPDVTMDPHAPDMPDENEEMDFEQWKDAFSKKP
jgi:hypothetical protein